MEDNPSSLALAAPRLAVGGVAERAPALSFEQLYRDYFAFTWRNLQRLGVAPSALDDAAQDVFLVVHRQLPGFEGRSSPKTWLFGIVLRVARDYRRGARRKGGLEPLDGQLASRAPGPDESAAQGESLRLVMRALDALDDDKRAVFVLAELEEMTVPEIAEALGIKLNTAYSRLRAARLEFERVVASVHPEGAP